MTKIFFVCGILKQNCIFTYGNLKYCCPLKIKNEFSIAVTIFKSECVIPTDKSKPPEIQTLAAIEIVLVQ